MIDIKNITKSFGSLQVLKGIDLHIDKGEVVSIVGPSGAGKSTLLQIIGTLDSPDNGEIMIDGVDVRRLNQKKLSDFRNRNIGFVFQFHQRLPEFTALENIMIPAFIAGMSKSEAKKRGMELLDFMGLADRAKHKPNELSGGEKQRVALNIEEVNQLVATPCQSDVLKRAFLFSVLTGMRHCDIKSLRWGQIEQVENGYRIGFTQKKTSVPEYLPISEQALALCGDRKSDNRLVCEGLQDPSWINRPLALWVKQAGITKHITFHCARHTFATLQITNGTDIYTVSKMLGHTNVRTTQIYAKVVDEKKEQAANAIKLKEPEHKDKDDC